MARNQSGSLQLSNLRGIDVFLHWPWFLVALIEIDSRAGTYATLTWNFVEYVGLFAIAMLHEPSHVFACPAEPRQRGSHCLGRSCGGAYVSRETEVPHLGPHLRPG